MFLTVHVYLVYIVLLASLSGLPLDIISWLLNLKIFLILYSWETVVYNCYCLYMQCIVNISWTIVHWCCIETGLLHSSLSQTQVSHWSVSYENITWTRFCASIIRRWLRMLNRSFSFLREFFFPAGIVLRWRSVLLPQYSSVFKVLATTLRVELASLYIK